MVLNIKREHCFKTEKRAVDYVAKNTQKTMHKCRVSHRQALHRCVSHLQVYKREKTNQRKDSKYSHLMFANNYKWSNKKKETVFLRQSKKRVKVRKVNSETSYEGNT